MHELIGRPIDAKHDPLAMKEHRRWKWLEHRRPGQTYDAAFLLSWAAGQLRNADGTSASIVLLRLESYARGALLEEVRQNWRARILAVKELMRFRGIGEEKNVYRSIARLQSQLDQLQAESEDEGKLSPQVQ